MINNELMTWLGQHIFKNVVTFWKNVQLGGATSTSTTAPISLDLGGDYSSTDGQNAKLKLYNDDTSVYGIGVSAAQMDFMVPTSAAFAFYINAVRKLTLSSDGHLSIIGLPTSSAGLSAGDIWIDTTAGNVLKIVT